MFHGLADIFRRNTTRSRTPNYIGRLLSEDWFLRKVLSCLIDDGLHECRRVCRKWNAVCKSLPVKLREVPLEHLREVLAAFPNAIELSRTVLFPPNDLDIARQLADMSSLKHLDRLDYFDIKHNDGLQFMHLEAYTRLRSLGVNLDAALYKDFGNVLSNMTGLERLDVNVGRDVDPLSWTPFTKLKRLRELSLSGGLLKNGSNQILFPSTVLTKLTVEHVPYANVSAPELLTV